LQLRRKSAVGLRGGAAAGEQQHQQPEDFHRASFAYKANSVAMRDYKSNVPVTKEANP
jgi:hypothetical protein